MTEPISAAYSPNNKVLVPSSRTDFEFAELSYTAIVDNPTGKYTKDNIISFYAGTLGMSFWNFDSYSANLFSFALPAGRGYSLGYSILTDDDVSHNFYLLDTPKHWLSIGLGLSSVAKNDAVFSCAVSFRPVKEYVTVSVQYNYMNEMQNAGTKLYPHGPHQAAVFINAYIGTFFDLNVKYDFNEFTAGAAIRLGNLYYGVDMDSLKIGGQAGRRDTYAVRIKESELVSRKFGKREELFGRKNFIILDLTGNISDLNGSSSGGVYTPSLLDLHYIVDKIVKNRQVHGVVLKLDAPGVGMAQAQEIREQIQYLKMNGKTVHVIGKTFSQVGYYIASAADKIVMSPMGSVDIKGLEFSTLYFKGLLDLLGVSFDVLQAGDYKSAGEPFVRTNMSKFSKEENERLLNELSIQVYPQIIKSRKLDMNADELIGDGPYQSEVAKEKNLIDGIGYYDETIQSLNESGVRFRPLSFLFQEKGRRWYGYFDKSIAVIEIEGEITEGVSVNNPLFGIKSSGADTIIKLLKEAHAYPSTKAILLRINSPGGSVLASDRIWHAVSEIITDRHKPIPVVASFGNVAASGGYYVSAYCNKIFVMPGTITGSIGVIYQKPSVAGLMKKLGVFEDGVAKGKNAGMGKITAPFTPAQKKKIQEEIMQTYSRFLDIVRDGRFKRNKEKNIDTLAGGRVWLGQEALSNGLADRSGGLSTAIESVIQEYRLPEEYFYIQHFEESESIFGQLLGAGSRLLYKNAKVYYRMLAFMPWLYTPEMIATLDKLHYLSERNVFPVEKDLLDYKKDAAAIINTSKGAKYKATDTYKVK
jgi:protease-4